MTKKELITHIRSGKSRLFILDDIRIIIFETFGEIYRYPNLNDPSRYIGVKLTDEEINKL